MDEKRNGTYTPPAFLNKWIAGTEMAEAHRLMMPDAEKPMPTPNGRGPLAMVSIVKQEWDEIYEPETGFHRGTIFPALDLPFMGEGACRRDRT